MTDNEKEIYKSALYDLLNKAKEHGLISTEFSFSALILYEDKKISEDDLWKYINNYSLIDLSNIINNLIEEVEIK